jgi:hypothetical protein
MSDSSKQIHDWQEKVRSDFGDENKLYQYLFETLDNFYYRYLETVETQDLHTQQLADKKYGAYSFESSMANALKTTHPEAKAGIMDLARAIPKAQKPLVRYGLWAQVKELTADRGELQIVAEINWGFPEYNECSNVKKTVPLQYNDLNQFRKELALTLEEACSLFS